MKILNLSAVLGLVLGILYTNTALATIHATAENRTYTRGEVMWIGKQTAIYQRYTLNKADVQNSYAKSGQIGIIVTASPNGGPGATPKKLPDFINYGYAKGIAWTLLGNLKGTFGDQKLTVNWRKNRWELPHIAGVSHTNNFQFAPSDLHQGLAATEKINFTSLFAEGNTKTSLILEGTVQLAMYCDAESCQIPTGQDTAAIDAAYVTINTPIIPVNEGTDSNGAGNATFPVVHPYWEDVVFDLVPVCTFKVDPTSHSTGAISVQSKKTTPALLFNAWKSTVSVKCDDGSPAARHAHIMFGSADPVIDTGLPVNTIGKTDLPGIGIVYSTQRLSLDGGCADAMPFDKTIDVGSGTNGLVVMPEPGQKPDSNANTKDIYFGVCRYQKQVEHKPFFGTLHYQHWLD